MKSKGLAGKKVEVRGAAELGSEGGRAYVKVTPSVKRSWGLR